MPIDRPNAPQATGHPLRTQLKLRDARARLRPRVRASDDDNDIRLFALSFTAFFVCFYTFLA